MKEKISFKYDRHQKCGRLEIDGRIVLLCLRKKERRFSFCGTYNLYGSGCTSAGGYGIELI